MLTIPENQLLADRIEKFIQKYAKISPNYEPNEDEDGKYTAPDVYQLLVSALSLKSNVKPDRCFSEYSCGGYIQSPQGREEHDYLVTEIYKIINSK